MPAGKVTINLPEGMDEAQFNQLFGTWRKQRVEGTAKGKATAAAIKALKARHQEEYDSLYEDELRKQKAGK